MNLTTRFLNWLFRRSPPRSKVLQGIELAQEVGIPSARVRDIMSWAMNENRAKYPDLFYKAILDEVDQPHNDH